MAESDQLTLNSSVAPAGVLAGHLQHEVADCGRCGWSAWSSVRVGPAAGHGRNAKLQLSVLLAPAEPADGLYRHPQHRRRSRRVNSLSDGSV
jgi:hypothetical protein